MTAAGIELERAPQPAATGPATGPADREEPAASAASGSAERQQ